LLDIEIVLLEVVSPLLVNIPPMGPRSIGFYEQAMKLVRSEAEEYLQAIAKRLNREGLAASSRVVLGPEAAGTILEVARQAGSGWWRSPLEARVVFGAWLWAASRIRSCVQPSFRSW
jgi:nucleotide-binding universal stress UspA family protein